MRVSRPFSAALSVIVMSGLIAVGGASPALAEDASCRTTEGSSPFYAGDSASQTYDDTFNKGPAVPAGLIDESYVPQGLAYWSNWRGTNEDILLISAYHDGNGDKEPDGSSAVFGVVVGGPNSGTGLGRMLIPQGHAGGIAIVSGYVYVSGEEKVRRWSTAKVRDALVGANGPFQYTDDGVQGVIGKGSFLGKQGDKVWVGNFNSDRHDHMYLYEPNSKGYLSYTGQSRWVPTKTQGVAVSDDKFIFGTSEGRTERSNVWIRPTSFTTDLTDNSAFCMRAPSMIEGVAAGSANGTARVWTVYESGSKTYRSTARNPIDHIHTASGAKLVGLYGAAD